MRNDSKSLMDEMAEKSIGAFLMTAKELTKGEKALDAEYTEHLHWAWEGVHHIMAAKLAAAQLEAHQAAHAPASADDMMRMLKAMGDKLDSLTGNGNAAAPAKA